MQRHPIAPKPSKPAELPPRALTEPQRAPTHSQSTRRAPQSASRAPIPLPEPTRVIPRALPKPAAASQGQSPPAPPRALPVPQSTTLAEHFHGSSGELWQGSGWLSGGSERALRALGKLGEYSGALEVRWECTGGLWECWELCDGYGELWGWMALNISET